MLNFLTNINKFFRESINEIKYIDYPSIKEVIYFSLLVIFIIFFISILILILDVIIINLFFIIIKLIG